MIAHWNARLNLLASAELAALWRRHILDSLQLACLIPTSAVRAIDIGSGAGFPGLVAALATGIPFRLVESDRRKAAFLREAARVIAAPAEVVNARVEELKDRADVVTARAVAPLSRLLDWCHPVLAPAGTCLFLKGESVDRELASAEAFWRMNVERFASATGAGGAVLRISSLARR